LLYLCPY